MRRGIAGHKIVKIGSPLKGGGKKGGGSYRGARKRARAVKSGRSSVQIRSAKERGEEEYLRERRRGGE